MCEGSNWNISEVNVIEETSKQERTKKKKDQINTALPPYHLSGFPHCLGP